MADVDPPIDPAPDPSHRTVHGDAKIPTGSTSQAERRAGFMVLSFGMMVIGMGQTLMFSILPPMARELGLSEIQVGAIFATSALAWVMVSPFWGRRSDTWGRRPVLLIGLGGYAVSMFGLTVAVQAGLAGWAPILAFYPAMIAARTVFGLFGSGIGPSAQAWVADRTSAQDRTQGVARLGAAFGLGNMVGPAIGAVLVAFGLLAPLYFVGALAILAIILVWRFLPERSAPLKREDRPKLSVRDRRAWPFLVLSVTMSVCMASAYQTVAFYFMDTLQLSATQTTRLVGIGMMAGAAMGLFTQVVLVRKLGLSPRALILSGILAGLVSFGLYVVAEHFYVLVAAMVMGGLSLGFSMPGITAAASLSVTPDEQGAIAGLIGASRGVGPIFAPLVGLNLYQFAPFAPYLLNMVLLSGALMLALFHPAVQAMKHVDKPPPNQADG